MRAVPWLGRWPVGCLSKTGIMARLIKIYDADWQKRRKRPAHREHALWFLSPGAMDSRMTVAVPFWLAAAELRSSRGVAATLPRPRAVLLHG